MAGNDEYDAEVRRRNFLRAAMIAEEAGLGDEALRSARRDAFKQLLGEWFNFRGAEAMAREWGFDSAEVSRLCGEIIDGFEERQKREARVIEVFDIRRMDHNPVVRLIGQFRDAFR